MKRKALILGTCLSLAVSAGVALAASPISLIINNQVVSSKEAPPQIINGRTMVPLRVVAESLGADVSWDGKTRTVEVKSPSIGQKNRQIQLLQDAIAPKTPKDAIKTWTQGVKTRNGALQFVALSPELKEKYRKDYEAFNWVTGTSSPWIETYEIIKETDKGNDTWEYQVKYDLMSSTGPSGSYTSTYKVQKDKENWFITSKSEAGTTPPERSRN